jgi:hypothetical protein
MDAFRMPLWRDADSFTEAGLSLLTRPTTAELCSFLRGLAHRDGFPLACKRAKDSDWNHFYCRHIDSDTVRCRISIRIGRHTRTTANPNAHVTSFSLERSSVLDALAFEHRPIDQDTVSLLRSMSEIGSTPGQLGMWLRKTKGISLSAQQVRNLVYGHDMALSRTAETEELKECMRGIGGLSFVRQNDRDGVAIHAAVARFTKQEIRNLADFGDLVAIDPTLPRLCLGWNVILLTVAGRDCESRSGGLVMSFTSRDRYLWTEIRMFRECL